MDLKFRAARPEDVAEAVPLIYASGPPTFDYVFADNPRAEALYQRCGFSTVNECVSKLPGVPDFRRMELEL